MRDGTEATESARAAAHAIQQLCRATLTRPSMTPAEVDVVLADLADAVAALPQAARQLGDILEQAKADQLMEMDGLTESTNPDLAIDTARLYLDAVRETALDLHRALDAAHNNTAHIAVVVHRIECGQRSAFSVPLPTHRPEERQPPPMGTGGADRGPTR